MTRFIEAVTVTARSLRVLRRAGLSAGPVDSVRSLRASRRYGPFAGVIAAAAAATAPPSRSPTTPVTSPSPNCTTG
ncbi:hypothetical protein [Mycobacterium sp. 1274756.6]|uniref:hypothetical protein n=1 Tax=Mycobacterium sp. 1274756.6 TaxID=1834076 RepID=UPI001E5B013D|nr:hypothetical protein [Mycobacterium sp. 1274756.6]